MLQLLLIRHGEPAYPADSLTPLGERQAELLGLRLATVGLFEIWTSPMGRARRTAEIVAQRLALPVREASWLAELESWAINDPVRGEIPAWEVDMASVREVSPGESTPRRGWGEIGALVTASALESSYANLGRAADEFLASFGYSRQGEGFAVAPDAFSGPLAVICHCGLALTWLAHLLALAPPIIWSRFTLAPASITHVEFESRQAAGGETAWPRCRSLGDVGHLAVATT